MAKFKQLVNPHSHSEHSIDGAATVKQIIQRNLELGTKYVTLTEHGNLNSSMELYSSALKMGAKPILGIEVYIEVPFKEYELGLIMAKMGASANEEKARKRLSQTYMHLTVHFRDDWAYRYFCSITPAMESRAIVKWGERKPLITWDELKAASGHITIGSGCLIGVVQKFMLEDRYRPDLAEAAYCMIRDIAGPDNFYVEIFPHKITHDWQRPVEENGKLTPGRFVAKGCNSITPDGDIQKVANQFVYAMSKKYNDPAIISLDSHFATTQQKVIQDCKLGNGLELWKFYNSYHIFSTDEAAEEIKHTLGVSDKEIEKMVDDSYKFASRFDDFKIPTSKDRWVLQSVDDNYMSQLKTVIDRHGRMDWNNPSMMERLKKEIDVLCHNGTINLLSYFFTVEDIANHCRENDILINVRGSAGGSLLLYLMGVSAVNPLDYNLSFERFLTLGRIKANTLPDVDIDVSTAGRDRLFQYFTEKYGDGFCQISVDALLKLKSSIKDAERSLLGGVRKETEAFCKTLPMQPQGVESNQFVFGYDDMGVHYPGIFDTNDQLKKYAAQNPQIWEVVKEMLGIQRQKGVHACGIVLTPEPVQTYCPVFTINGTRVTGFSPKSVETAGLVKYDILGLNTLRDIESALASIKTRAGLTLNPWKLPYDEKSYDEFGLGNTETVFQFDTTTVRPYLIATKPRSIEGLAAITSLCRPGTLDAPNGDGRTLAQVYVARAQGEPIQYVHQDLEPILKGTMGIQLYQEQTLQIFRDIAGMTFEEAEVVRRGIGKKDKAVLSSATGRLKDACLTKGWTEEQVKLLIDQIMASANYSFNKSHAVSYAAVAYACMYLKTNHRLDWWKATLSNASKEELASKFWRFVKEFTTLPDINNSSDSYQIRGDKLVAPLSIINGLGEKGYEQLTRNAPYASLENYVQAHHAKLPKGQRSSIHTGISHKLISAGILDSLFEPNMLLEEKMYRFEQVKASIRGEKKVTPVPAEYIGVTALGQYLIKKQLISIYSEDLRPLLLPSRGGKKVDDFIWSTQNDVWLFDGRSIEHMKSVAERGEGPYEAMYVGCIAYVVDERTFAYKNKTRQGTELVLDINGTFMQDVFWPAYSDDPSKFVAAPNGFVDTPVLVVYKYQFKRMTIVSVSPLVERAALEQYNVVY